MGCRFEPKQGAGFVRNGVPVAAVFRCRLEPIYAAMAQHVLLQDPLSGHLFVFVGKTRKRIKILWWDRDGHCLWHKRLAKGTFTPPAQHDGKICISPAQLQLLLLGITPKRLSRRWERS